jgi:alpha-aminoadipate carrier protein LysW
VPFGTLRAQYVTNKSQCLKETHLNLRSISNNKKRGNKIMIKPSVNLKPQEVKTINKARCPDCEAELDVPADTVKGEILSCPGCGLELEVKQIEAGCVDLQELTIEGEDWGE